MKFKQVVLDLANVPLRVINASLVPYRDYIQLVDLRENIDKPCSFRFGSQVYQQFAHNFNCGWPWLSTATERSVDLAVADHFLNTIDATDLCEVSAVTPYNWPRRVRNILDPYDTHPLVSERKSIFDCDLSGKSILSISTFEHIGIGDYGLPIDSSGPMNALRKVFRESTRFLITYASGYNLGLDQCPIDREGFPDDIDSRLLVRNRSGVGWSEKVASRENLRDYGSAGGNSVFFLSRGTNLFGG